MCAALDPQAPCSLGLGQADLIQAGWLTLRWLLYDEVSDLRRKFPAHGLRTAGDSLFFTKGVATAVVSFSCADFNGCKAESGRRPTSSCPWPA